MSGTKKFRVSISFKDCQIVVTAKNANDARRKVYAKLAKENGAKRIDKSQTEIEG